MRKSPLFSKRKARNLDKKISTLNLSEDVGISEFKFQKNLDSQAVRETALDYIESWYEGNPEQMKKSLHPELANRKMSVNAETGKSQLFQMSVMSLLKKAGEVTFPLKEKQQKEVTAF